MTTETESGRRVGPDSAFAEVPGQILEHPALGPVAVRIWGYSWWRLGLKNWVLRKADICRRCRIGDHAWKKAIKELTAANLYRLERGSFQAGSKNDQGDPIGGQQFVVHVFYWPGALDSPVAAAAPPKVPGRVAAQSVSAVRLAAARVSGGARKNKIYREKEAEEAPRAPAAAQSKKIRIQRKSGIVTWLEEDVAQAEIIEAKEQETDVREAADALAELGKDPVPGLVQRQIQQARARRIEKERAKARGTGCSPPVPVSLTLSDELKYIEQMYIYKKFSEAERDQHIAEARARFARPA